jgi:hypothetical protein
MSEKSGTASDLAAMHGIRLDIGELKWGCGSNPMRRFNFLF